MRHYHLHLPFLVHLLIVGLVNAVEQVVDGLLHPLQWFEQIVEQVPLVGERLLVDRLLHLDQHLGHFRLEPGEKGADSTFAL